MPDHSAALDELLSAAVARALEALEEDGHIDAATQEEVDAIAAMADDPEALAEIAKRMGGDHAGDAGR